MAQTIGTEDPNKISGVLADYVSIKVALIYNYKAAGITDTEWADMFRAVYRPRAGKHACVWTLEKVVPERFSIQTTYLLDPLIENNAPEHYDMKRVPAY